MTDSTPATAAKREHDFDPVTWKCRRCTVHATEGIACRPHPDEAATDVHEHVFRCQDCGEIRA